MKALRCPACDGALDGKNPSRCPYCGSWLAVDEGVVVVDQIERAVGNALKAERQEQEQREFEASYEERRAEWHERLDQIQQMIFEKQTSGNDSSADLSMAELRRQEREAMEFINLTFGDEVKPRPKSIMMGRVWLVAGIVGTGLFLWFQDIGIALIVSLAVAVVTAFWARE